VVGLPVCAITEINLKMKTTQVALSAVRILLFPRVLAFDTDLLKILTRVKFDINAAKIRWAISQG
jgi:hypothetical protein